MSAANVEVTRTPGKYRERDVNAVIQEDGSGICADSEEGGMAQVHVSHASSHNVITQRECQVHTHEEEPHKNVGKPPSQAGLQEPVIRARPRPGCTS